MEPFVRAYAIAEISGVKKQLRGGNGKTVDDILFVVYTERTLYQEGEKELEITRLISARLATSFERGLYYGKYS